MIGVVNFLLNIVFYNVFEIFGLGDTINLPLSIAVLLIGYTYLMFRLRFIQFTHFGKMLKYTFSKDSSTTTSPIKTLLTSIASCTGMNATAGIVFMVAVGGIGTIFWLPIIAFLCMPFRFAEVYLSHSYRSAKVDLSTIGGPFDYIKKGLSDIGFKKTGEVLALLYAIMLAIAGTIGVSMYEMNQAVVVLEKNFSFFNNQRLLLTIALTIIALWIIFGGTKRVVNFMSIALPVLSITYVLISIIVVAFNYKSLGSVFTLIFNDAMHPRSISGGIIGSFCLCARKCCLSHETGLGTSGIVHALSPEKDSFKEALRSMMTPLITGLIVCLSTALVLTTTGTYNDAEIMKDGVSALSYAFGSTYWLFSYVVVAIIPMFTANVMIGWSNYIVKCSQYILNKKQFAHMMTILFFTFAFIGGIINDFFFVMDVVDLILMFILLINVPIIMVLSGKVYKAIKEYKF